MSLIFERFRRAAIGAGAAVALIASTYAWSVRLEVVPSPLDLPTAFVVLGAAALLGASVAARDGVFSLRRRSAAARIGVAAVAGALGAAIIAVWASIEPWSASTIGPTPSGLPDALGALASLAAVAVIGRPGAMTLAYLSSLVFGAWLGGPVAAFPALALAQVALIMAPAELGLRLMRAISRDEVSVPSTAGLAALGALLGAGSLASEALLLPGALGDVALTGEALETVLATAASGALIAWVVGRIRRRRSGYAVSGAGADAEGGAEGGEAQGGDPVVADIDGTSLATGPRAISQDQGDRHGAAAIGRTAKSAARGNLRWTGPLLDATSGDAGSPQ